MLTLLDFNLLTANEKAEAVWQGTFLADRRAEGFMVQLYGLGSFYVEVFYNTSTNTISHMEALTTKKVQNPLF